MQLSSRIVYQAICDKKWPLPVRDHYPPDFASQIKGHDPTSVMDKLCQRMLPEVEEKVRSLVTEAHLHNLNLKLVLEDWVRNQLIPKHKQEGILQETPNHYNRGYFPTTKDLRNVAQQAIMQSRRGNWKSREREMGREQERERERDWNDTVGVTS